LTAYPTGVEDWRELRKLTLWQMSLPPAAATGTVVSVTVRSTADMGNDDDDDSDLEIDASAFSPTKKEAQPKDGGRAASGAKVAAGAGEQAKGGAKESKAVVKVAAEAKVAVDPAEAKSEQAKPDDASEAVPAVSTRLRVEKLVPLSLGAAEPVAKVAPWDPFGKPVLQ
jgi:hypothetical protein